MARPGKKKFEPVDYLMRTGERRRLTNYLRAGNSRRFAGRKFIGHAIKRNRVVLALVALAIIVIGMIYVSR